MRTWRQSLIFPLARGWALHSITTPLAASVVGEDTDKAPWDAIAIPAAGSAWGFRPDE